MPLCFLGWPLIAPPPKKSRSSDVIGLGALAAFSSQLDRGLAVRDCFGEQTGRNKGIMDFLSEVIVQ